MFEVSCGERRSSDDATGQISQRAICVWFDVKGELGRMSYIAGAQTQPRNLILHISLKGDKESCSIASS